MPLSKLSEATTHIEGGGGGGGGGGEDEGAGGGGEGGGGEGGGGAGGEGGGEGGGGEGGGDDGGGGECLASHLVAMVARDIALTCVTFFRMRAFLRIALFISRTDWKFLEGLSLFVASLAACVPSGSMELFRWYLPAML
uniref:Uncharacterized protein n=1 Tax=Pyramimonas obovata TaxID=1411642 RepID=A0A7S0QTT7_9CHLO